MPVLIDYHTHTLHSIDARGSVPELVEVAQACGITELAVTDHVDFVPSDESCGFFRPMEYLEDVKAIQAKPGTGVNVLSGIELGIEPLYLDQAKKVAGMLFYRQLDFVIGSIHAVDGVLLGQSYYANRSRRQAFVDYLTDLKKAVEETTALHLFDVVGHFDLVKRYAPAGFVNGWLDEATDVVEDVLRAIINSGVGLEVNVSGLRQAPKEQFPGLAVLRMYRQLGGEIVTVGSDSHTPLTLSQSVPLLEKGLEVVREAGFKYICSFRQRRPRFLAL